MLHKSKYHILVGGLEHLDNFSHHIGNVIIPTDEVIFFRGVGIPPTSIYTLWLFNIAMENGPSIDDFPIKTSIYKGFSMAMLNNQMVYIYIYTQVL